jgi:predicted phosphodiesterase
VLINLGDFFHANDLKNQTPGSGHGLDVDGRAGMIIRAAGQLYKRLVTRMLETHNEVWIVNVRGNHDPDAALWLNEMVKLYYEKETRVKVYDNYNKFINFTWGDNLVVLHHGDKINLQRIYETITRVLAKEWGESKHRFAWTGHIHHKQAHEVGGLNHESWNVLPPPDAWHAASGYGASRSMTAVLLHKVLGEHSRFKVGASEL